MKIALGLALFLLAACAGCTSVAVQEYTLSQNRTSGAIRDDLTLTCLAAVAANPDALPSFALVSSGLPSVTDSVNLSHTATWTHGGYTSEAFGAMASTTPKGQWNVDPVAEYERLEAVHAACLWALFGPERANTIYAGILGDPRVYLDQKPHFNVEHRLARLRPGWVGVGTHHDVPACARYKGHKGDTWVWVMPDDAAAFADFALSLLDIATLDVTAIYTNPILVTLTVYRLTKIPDLSDPTKKVVTIATSETRAVKPEYRGVIEDAIRAGFEQKQVPLSRAQWLAYTEPWFGTRTAPAASPAMTMAGRAGPGLFLPPVTGQLSLPPLVPQGRPAFLAPP